MANAGSVDILLTTTVVNKNGSAVRLAGDLPALIQSLRNHGVPERDVKRLEELLVHENDVSGIGCGAVRWVALAKRAVENGAWRDVRELEILNSFLAYYGITITSRPAI